MTFSPTSAEALQRALDGLKKRNPGKRPLTNYFLNRLDDRSNLRVLESERSVCFLHDEWDFGRLYFNSHDLADLEKLLERATWPPITVLDWIAKDGSGAVDPLLTRLGFHVHAVYDRILCRQFRAEQVDDSLCMALDSDLDFIHNALFRIFDKYGDHIMPAAELGRLIAERQVLVSRSGQNEMDGFVVFPIASNTCNFNFLHNTAGPQHLVRLLKNFYGSLASREVKTGFSWVRRTRPLVLRLHQSFGWQLDGLVDYIYLR